MPVPPPPVVDAALAVRRVLLRAADALLPPEAAVFDRPMGIARTQVIGTIAELVGPYLLTSSGPVTAEDLAPRLAVDADALHRVLRAAAVDGLVRLDRR